MKFRILDLFAITTYIAILFAAFQNDLILFRQLLFLTLTAIAATIGYFSFPSWKDRCGKSAIAGSFGGLFFAGLAGLFHDYFYEPVSQFVPLPQKGFHFSQHLMELSLGPMVAAALGAGLGPLVASFIRKTDKKDWPNLERNRLCSSLLLGAALILCFFTMQDRVRMAATGRNWNVLLALVLIAFVGFTISWNRARPSAKEYQPKPKPLPASPDLEAKS